MEPYSHHFLKLDGGSMLQLSLPLELVTSTPVKLTPPKKLRDYQKRVIAEIYRWYRDGKRSVMLVSPTGSGKTLTAVHVISNAIERYCRVLFIVHREPLVDQTVNTLVDYGISSDEIGYIKAGYPTCLGHESVIVASIQTLARRDYPPNIGLIIFDETHTTSFWESSQQLIAHYSQAPCVALSKVKFLHLTATPFRTKTKEYFPHVQAIVSAPDIAELIKLGYLVKARHYGYGGLLDYTKLENGADGDFKQSQLSIVCSSPEYNQEIVQRYQQICPERKAIAFCAGVEQSELLTELFNEAGIRTEHIQAETPHEIRKGIYARFRTGETQIMSSVGTLTEGFDEPSTEAVILARPTRSVALLIQMCGRGLRLADNKEDCLLLDFGDNFKRLGRIDRSRKLSLCPNSLKLMDSEKQCPRCRAMINKFSRICPECGYEFPTGMKEEEEEDLFLPEFGELFDEETRRKISYIRGQRKARFTKGLPPDVLWDKWNEHFPKDILCNDWLHEAVFRGNKSEAAQQAFLSYLHSFINPSNKNTHNWVRFHMEIEFCPPKNRAPEGVTSKLNLQQVKGLPLYFDEKSKI
jgi:superfamily II DNA or RNA helicase